MRRTLPSTARAISSYRNVTETLKGAAKAVDQTAARAALKGLEAAEQVRNVVGSGAKGVAGKAAETGGRAAGTAKEFTGDAAGKAAEVGGRASGAAKEYTGAAAGKAAEMGGKAKGAYSESRS